MKCKSDLRENWNFFLDWSLCQTRPSRRSHYIWSYRFRRISFSSSSLDHFFEQIPPFFSVTKIVSENELGTGYFEILLVRVYPCNDYVLVLSSNLLRFLSTCAFESYRRPTNSCRKLFETSLQNRGEWRSTRVSVVLTSIRHHPFGRRCPNKYPRIWNE